jgi:hypothetical protein
VPLAFALKGHMPVQKESHPERAKDNGDYFFTPETFQKNQSFLEFCGRIA